jgi:hypothetical protein
LPAPASYKLGMSSSIDPRFAAAVTQSIVTALTDALCASTPMLSWHQRGTDGTCWGGSAFFVRTPTGILGITAGHVVDGFIAARRERADIAATLGGLTFDLEKSIIDRGRSVDIFTFRVSEAELSVVGFRPLENAWPPAVPASNGIVLLAGWPGHERVVGEHVTGGLYIGWGSAGVSHLQLTIRVDHEKGTFSPLPKVPLPPPGFEFGGISGGPVMLIDAGDDRPGIKWRVAAVIKEGKPDYNLIVATRADVINDDGRITG